MPFGLQRKEEDISDKLKDLVSKGNLPDIPEVLNAIKTGKVPLEQVLERHKAAAAPVEPIAPKAETVNLSSPVDVQKTKIIDDFVAKDELPNIPEVLNSIRTGKVPIEQVLQRHKEAKEGNAVVAVNEQGQVNKPDDLVAIAKQDTTFGDRLVEGFTLSAKKAQYVAKKFGAGLTFGIYEPEQQAPDLASALTGAIAELAGGIVSGIPISAAMGAIPVIAKIGGAVKGAEETISALKTLGQVVPKGLKAARYGLEAGRIAAEAAPLGAVVGTTKSLLKGNDVTDAVVDGIITAGEFTAFGLALQPVVGGLGALAERRQAGKFAKATAVLKGSEKAQALAKSGMDKVDDAISFFKAKPEITADETIQLNSLEKIKVLQPKFGTDLPTALLNNPEAIQGLSRVQMQKAADSMLLNPDAPFRAIYDSNTALKKMVDTGQYAKAFDSLNSLVAQQIKKNPDAADFLSAPFAKDGKALYDTMAERIIARNDPKKLGSFTTELFTNYAINPNAENTLLVQQATSRKVFGQAKKAAEGIQDVRIRPQEVGPLTEKVITQHLKNISGEPIAFSELGQLRDTNAIIRSAVTLNRDFHRTLIQAVKRDLKPSFMTAPKEMQEFIPDAIKLRGLVEQNGESINVKNKILGKMSDIRAKLRTSSGDTKISLRSDLSVERDKLSQMTGKIGYENKQISSLNTKLDSVGPELRTQIDSFAAEVYLPTRSQQVGMERAVQEGTALRNVPKTTTGETATADFTSRYGLQKNPKYLRADSDLADSLQALTTIGKDFSVEEPKVFSINFLNGASRVLRKELGYGNAIETGIIEPYRQIEVAKNNAISDFLKRVQDTGIKAGSEESKLAFKYGDNPLFRTSDEFLKLPQATREKVADAASKFRGMYDELVGAINVKMRDMNWPEVTKRDDYMTHFMESGDKFTEMLDMILGGAEKQAAYDATPFNSKPFNIKSVYDQGKTRFQFEWKRTGGEFTEDAVLAMQKYLEPAMDRIFTTELLREVDTARNFSPDGAGKFLDFIKNKVILKKPNVIEETTGKGFRTAAEWVGKKRSESMILGSINFIYQNISSNALNFAFNGRDAITSIPKMLTKEGDAIWAMSKNRELRNILEYDEKQSSSWFKKNVLNKVAGEKAAGKITDGAGYIKNFMMNAMQLFDSQAAKHSYISAFQKGTRLGLDKEAASKLADDVTGMVHNNLSRIDRPEFFNSSAGRAFGKFQSFSMNLAATILNDIPLMASKAGAAESVNTLLKGYAAMTLTNAATSSVGLPEPFDPYIAIPFLGGYRYGTDVDIGKVIAAIQEDKPWWGKAGKAAANVATQLAGPGALQVKKTGGALIDFATGKIKAKQLPVAMLFGSARAEKIEKKKAPKESVFRKEVKGVIGKKLFGREFGRKSVSY